MNALGAYTNFMVNSYQKGSPRGTRWTELGFSDWLHTYREREIHKLPNTNHKKKSNFFLEHQCSLKGTPGIVCSFSIIYKLQKLLASAEIMGIP